MRWGVAILGIAALGGAAVSGAAMARDSLGIFEGWGAFRDASPDRCYAIAEPVDESAGSWRPFASVSNWPERGVRGQIHIRLSHEKRQSADVMLTIDDRIWRLVAGRFDVWAPSAQHDAYIVAKMRSGKSMTVTSRTASGERFADTYALKGAATAIDAAALGCARTR
jgi:hypothetical protein